MFKRVKLPPTIIISTVDDDTIAVLPRRLPADDHDALVAAFSHDKRRHRKYTVPLARYGEVQAFAVRRDIKCDPIPTCVAALRAGRAPAPFDASRCGPIWEKLYPYQREGVTTILTKFHSRALLADDMGLGKTMQGVAWIDYAHERRTLILCPSYLRYHWLSQLEAYVDASVAVLRKKKDLDALRSAAIHIVSYDMLHGCSLGTYETVLCDESHYLKNRLAKRTKAAMPIMRRARNLLLLSGTPAVNRPIELFTQLHALQPRWFRTYTAFAMRFCNAKRTQYGLDVRGSSCVEELNYILTRGLMLRRRKEDMLDLPPKTRENWRLELPDSALKDIRKGWSEWHRLNEVIHTSGSEEAKQEAFFQRKSLMSEMFRRTCAAKKSAVVRFVRDMVEREKFILFAYHKDMLDALEESMDVPYIRIDGSTAAEKRPELVERFQTDDNVRIALLSIGAAGTGLTLTAASTVVFAELYWVPGALLQAEDRVHRISQQKPVTIHYLIGAKTLDERVFPILIDKLKSLDAVVDNNTARTLEGKQHTVLEDVTDMLDNLVPP